MSFAVERLRSHAASASRTPPRESAPEFTYANQIPVICKPDTSIDVDDHARADSPCVDRRVVARQDA
jgi:hypothetical protein